MKDKPQKIKLGDEEWNVPMSLEELKIWCTTVVLNSSGSWLEDQRVQAAILLEKLTKEDKKLKYLIRTSITVFKVESILSGLKESLTHGTTFIIKCFLRQNMMSTHSHAW